LRLCKTDPSAIFSEYAWNAETIKSRQDTIAWVAARKNLGDVWSSKVFNLSKEAEEMEVGDDSNKEIDTAKEVTPEKSVIWTVIGNKQKEKEKEKGNKESENQNDTRPTPAVNKFFLSKAIR
jgi:hypothetical protein